VAVTSVVAGARARMLGLLEKVAHVGEEALTLHAHREVRASRGDNDQDALIWTGFGGDDLLQVLRRIGLPG
jgi:hypothetical protein